MLLAALSGGATQAEAAERAGVSERTVRRRLEDPAFGEQLDHAQSELVLQTLSRLTAGAVDAADTLRALLGSEHEMVRLSAARSILALVMKLREHRDVDERIAALEGRC